MKRSEMIDALNTMAVYLIALLICVFVGASWLLDGPSETDTVATVALDLNDAVADAQVSHQQQLKERP